MLVALPVCSIVRMGIDCSCIVDITKDRLVKPIQSNSVYALKME
jgi:hypothetical protein